MAIQQPDPHIRQKVIGIALAGIVLFLITSIFVLLNPGIIHQYQNYLKAYFIGNPDLMVYSALAASIPIIIFSAYLFILGHKVIKQERFPITGQKVIRETKISTGNAAVSRGRIIQILAIFLLIVSGTLPIVLWLLVQSVKHMA